MEINENENATCNKLKNPGTKFTNSQQPKPNFDNDDIYENIILHPSKPSTNHCNAIVGSNTTSDALAVKNQETAHPWWRKRQSKWVLTTITLGASVCLVVWITAAIVWTGEDDSPQITPIVQHSKKHNIIQDDNSKISLIAQKGKKATIIQKGMNHTEENIFQISSISQTGRKNTLVRPGFTAWAQASVDYRKAKVIKFNGVLLNEGGLYSNATVRFSCDISGVYYVAFNLKRMSKTLSVTVFKGRYARLSAYSDHRINSGISITNARLVVCKAGEKLFLKSEASGSVYGEPAVPHSTFTAFLMQETGTNVTRNNSFVGYSASAKDPAKQKYVRGDTIKFSRVLYNEGGHFKPSTNRFICPLTGVYFVSVAVCRYWNHPVYLHVTKSTQPFLHAVDSDNKNSYTSTSNTALIRCQQNEAIVAEAMRNGTVRGYFAVRSPFNIMLLHHYDVHGVNSFIGFSVYKKTTQTYSKNHTISFEGELMNEANYFQLKLNYFVCPVKAIYYISLNAKKQRKKNLILDVKVDSYLVFRVESTEAKYRYSVMSNSGLVWCFAGQMMHVQGAGTGSVFGHRSEMHTTFTAFMLHQY